MINTLRPLRLGELLDRAVRIYRHNFWQLIGIVALVQIPITLAQVLVSLTMFGNSFAQLGAALNNPAAAPEDPFSLFGPAYFVGASLNSIIGIVGFVLLQGIATAALTAAIAGSYFGNPPTSIWDAYKRIKESWVSVVGALLLAVFLAILLGLWWFVPCAGWFTGGGMLLFLWYIIVPMLAPIIILEGGSPTQAWRRAWTLARRRFWWVLAFAVALYLFNLLIVAGPAAVVNFGSQFLFGNPLEIDNQRFALQTVVQAITILITSIFSLPLQVAGMTLLYLDLRVRTEGADLALAAHASSSAPAPALAFASAPTSGVAEPLMTGIDWRNFAVLTLGVLVVIALLYSLLVALVLALFAAFGGL